MCRLQVHVAFLCVSSLLWVGRASGCRRRANGCDDDGDDGEADSVGSAGSENSLGTRAYPKEVDCSRWKILEEDLDAEAMDELNGYVTHELKVWPSCS